MNKQVTDEFEKVSTYIDENEIKTLLEKLITIESHKEVSTEEKELATYIYDLLKSEDIETELDFVAENRPNVYGFLGDKQKGNSLMLNGHIDTVPAYGMPNAFHPQMEDGKLYGRGAVDMKGAIVAMLISLFAIKRAGIDLNGQVIFTGVIDEEKRCTGTEKIARTGYPTADFAIVGEPTDMAIMYGHKGMEWIEVTVQGKSVHGSTPQLGTNAIYHASKLIERIQSHLLPQMSDRAHPELGEPTLNVGKIVGGRDPNVVPDSCSIQIDRRWVPTESINSMQEDIRLLIYELQQEDPGFEASVRRMTEATGTHFPLFTPKNHPTIKILQEASRVDSLKKPELGVFPGWSDGAQLSQAGIPSVVCGPGSLGLAHSNDEYIHIADVVHAAKVYTYTVLKALN